MMQKVCDLPPEQYWRDAFSEGRFLLQRDPTNAQHCFPPRLASPTGGSLEWVEAAGTGVVYSLTIVRPRPPAEPYNVVLVELTEGPRLMSRVDGIAAEKVAIGMAVKARIEGANGQRLLVFHPA